MLERVHHLGSELQALKVVNGRGIESLLVTKIGATGGCLEVHLDLWHALRHLHLDLRGEVCLGRNEFTCVESTRLEALSLGHLWHEFGHRVAEATCWLHIGCARAEAGGLIGCELLRRLHHWLLVGLGLLRRGEARLEDRAVG